MKPKTEVVLLSTAVAPTFKPGNLKLYPVEDHGKALAMITRNLHGHAPTVTALRQICPTLPDAVREFWDGQGLALAIRPEGGIRGGGDVDPDVLEWTWVVWEEVPERGYLRLPGQTTELSPSPYDKKKWGCPVCGWPLGFVYPWSRSTNTAAPCAGGLWTAKTTWETDV